MPPLQARVKPESDGNEGVLHIHQSSCITGTSLSNCLVSYQGHSLRGSLQRSSQCILRPQLTGLIRWVNICFHMYTELLVYLVECLSLPFPAPQCCSYWKKSLQVPHEYGPQPYFILYIYIYIWLLLTTLVMDFRNS